MNGSPTPLLDELIERAYEYYEAGKGPAVRATDDYQIPDEPGMEFVLYPLAAVWMALEGKVTPENVAQLFTELTTRWPDARPDVDDGHPTSWSDLVERVLWHPLADEIKRRFPNHRETDRERNSQFLKLQWAVGPPD